MKCLLLLSLLFIATGAMAQAQNQSIGGTLAESTDPSELALAPVYVADDGAIVYLRETDQAVYWFAEHPGRGYAHVFKGRRNGATIRGRMISVPKYGSTKTGRVTLQIRTGGVLHQVGQAMNAPFRRLDPRAMAEVKDKLPTPGFPAFQSRSGADFDGGYEDARGRRYYVRTLENRVVFFVESQFRSGKRPKAAFVFFGKWTGADRRFATGELIAMPKGQRRASGQFSLGFLEDRSLSGQSDFAHLQAVLAAPMIQTQSLRLLGDKTQQDYPVTIDNGLVTVEGDILVGEIPRVQGGQIPAVVLADRGRLWPNCEVPFDFDTTFFGQQPNETANARAIRQAVRANIDAAIADWNNSAAITWRRRKESDSDFVVFTPRTNLCVGPMGSITCGRSPLGRQGGAQQILFSRPTATGNVLASGTFMHEMGHAVGLSHEHTRIDREDFVDIQWPAIIPGFLGNFRQRSNSSRELGAYDYGSIMHYGPRAFSADGSATIVPLRSGVTIGQRTALSAGDIAGIKSFCPGVIQAQGVGQRGDGAGITLIQADDDPELELLLMAYDDAEGQNGFKLRLCEFSHNYSALNCQSEAFRIDGLGHRGSGAGIAAGRLLGIANEQDLVVAAYDTSGVVKYRVCRDFPSNGVSDCSASRTVLNGQRFGARADGLGVAIGNVNRSGPREVVIASLDDSEGPNRLKWSVGRGFGDNAQAVTWSPLNSTAGPGPFSVFTLGHRGSGLGLALVNQNNNANLEMVFGVLDDGQGDDPFDIITMEDLTLNGDITGDARIRRYQGHGHSAEGAGIAIGDIDNDGARDLILMSYDDPDNDDDRENQFKLRIIFAGGDR